MNPTVQKLPTRVPVPGLAPSRRRSATRDPGEIVLRTSLGADGQVLVEEIPLTLDILLNPREEDKVTQGNPHYRLLYPLTMRLQRFFERRRRGWGVFSDVIVTWAKKDLRPVSPDLSVVEDIADPAAVGSSLDVAAEGCRVRAVIEVVTTTSKLKRDKDEKHNRVLYAAAGVEDYVLLYPREYRKPGDRPVRCFALKAGVHGEQETDAEGGFLLRSLGLRLSIGESEELLLEDVATGERILSWDEEEELRLQAERRAAEADRRSAEADRRSAQLLVSVLENRGLDLDDDARQRILDCRDGEALERWIRRAFTAATVDQLWNE